MRPGYTRLLIHEKIIPPTGAMPEATAVDLCMMSLFGAKERTHADWRRLIESAGLKLNGVWPGQGIPESVLECVLEEGV